MSSLPVPPAEEQLLETDAFALDLFWERFRTTILVLAAAVVISVVAVVLWMINSHNSRLAAQAQFAKADGSEEWQQVIEKYPSSPQAANAYLLLGGAQREAGDLEASTTTFQDFLVKFPKSQLLGEAWLGLAENLDLEGKSAEAIKVLEEIQAGQADSYVAAYAAFLEGRLAVREGRLEDARKMFSALVATYPTSPVARLAGAQVDELIPFLPPRTTSDVPPAVQPETDG